MEDDLLNQYSILANTGFKIVTIDGEDLTEDFLSLNPPIFNGRVNNDFYL